MSHVLLTFASTVAAPLITIYLFYGFRDFASRHHGHGPRRFR